MMNTSRANTWICLTAILFLLLTSRIDALNIHSQAAIVERDYTPNGYALTWEQTRDISPVLDTRENILQSAGSQTHQQKLQSCIAACSACAIECKSCLNECLNEYDVKALTRCIRLNQDCAAMCMLAVESMASGSEFAKPICSLSADICYTCALECEKHSQMNHCKKCAEVCRKCSIECSKMSKA